MKISKHQRILTMLFVSFALSCSSTFSEDKVVGIIWQFGTKGFDGKAKETKWMGTFRATPDGKVWTANPVGLNYITGHWNGDEENTVLTIDGIREPKHKGANGKYEVQLVGKDPKIWQGIFTSKLVPDLEIPVWFRLVQD